MAGKFPYMSGSAGLIQTVKQFRSTFPAKVTADTLKKLSIAPNNETYVINILRFIGALDKDGNRTPEGQKVFTTHGDEGFQKGLSELVKAAYQELFNLHGDPSWSLSSDQLISFFRGSDHTSAIVGQRQATTFQTLASLGGHGSVPTAKSTTSKTMSKGKQPAKKQAAKQAAATTTEQKTPPVVVGNGGGGETKAVGLTVRIEVNLPAAADQETYDKIFKSIRENLLNG